MKNLLAPCAFGVAALLAGTVPPASAAAFPAVPLARAALAVPASADCYSIGQRVAAQNGGQLGKATATVQGGKPVCVVVVLFPAKDGERPRRTQIVVPQE